mmetsp:Transcript_182/g.581  ORF Transcript_182/g.581 Transcript_182/m.581 type:complete len:342 (-) Transcript_182:23-1048(-)
MNIFVLSVCVGILLAVTTTAVPFECPANCAEVSDGCNACRCSKAGEAYDCTFRRCPSLYEPTCTRLRDCPKAIAPETDCKRPRDIPCPEECPDRCHLHPRTCNFCAKKTCRPPSGHEKPKLDTCEECPNAQQLQCPRNCKRCVTTRSTRNKCPEARCLEYFAEEVDPGRCAAISCLFPPLAPERCPDSYSILLPGTCLTCARSVCNCPRRGRKCPTKRPTCDSSCSGTCVVLPKTRRRCARAVCLQRPPTCPRGCQSFFDGCNTCTCRSDGLAICTKRFCESLQPSKCLDEEPECIVCAQVVPPCPDSCPGNCVRTPQTCTSCAQAFCAPIPLPLSAANSQ